MKIFRHAVYNILTGAITYGGDTILVHDEKRPENATGPKLFILLGTQQETYEDTHDTFITRSSIDIEIVQKRGAGVAKDAIDDVSNSVLEILFPTPGTDELFTDPSFHITDLRREQSISRALEISPVESIIRKIITVSSRFVQAY